MAIAVQTDARYGSDGIDRLVRRLEQRAGDLFVLVGHGVFEQRRRQQRIACLPAEPLAGERHPVREPLPRADRMHAPERTADELQGPTRVDLDRARREPREHGVPQPCMPGQGRALEDDRRRHRQVRGGEFGRERVLLEDLRVAPAARPVELQHQHAVRGRAQLIDAVLVGVEGEEPPVAVDAEPLGGRQHLVGGESREGLPVGRRGHGPL